MAEVKERKAPKKLTKWQMFLNHLYFYTFTYQSQSQSRKAGIHLCGAFAMLADKLYPGNAERQKELLERYSGFYMTDYTWGGALHGVLVGMEEKRAQDVYETGDSELSTELIEGIKNGLMGPLAGFGDTINQSVVRAATIAYSQPLAAAGNPLGAIVGFLGNDFYRWIVSFSTFFLGYKGGLDFVEKLTSSKAVDKALTIAGIFSMMMMGSLAAKNVKFATVIQITESMSFDKMIETMLPGLYQLAPPLIIYWLISKKKVDTTWIIIGILVICLILAAIGII